MPIVWEEYGWVHDAFIAAENDEQDALKNNKATNEYEYHYLLTELYKATFEVIAMLAPAVKNENDQDHGIASTLQASFVEKMGGLIDRIKLVVKSSWHVPKSDSSSIWVHFDRYESDALHFSHYTSLLRHHTECISVSK